jgi:AcrR family transcriptional regulator
MVRQDGVHSKLIEAAYELLVSEGPAALTVRRIASEAGMSTMNVYSRFGDKDGIVEHLFMRGYGTLAAMLEAAQQQDNPLDGMRQMAFTLRRFALENVSMYRLMFLAAVPEYVPSEAAREFGEQAIAEIATRFEHIMDLGLIRRLDPTFCAVAQWATAHGMISLELSSVSAVGIDWSGAFDAAIDNLYRGFTP